MFWTAARDHAADLAVARETATWWHAAAQREAQRADRAEEEARLWADRYARIVERLLASAASRQAEPATADVTAQPEAEPAPQMPPEVVAAVRRMAGKSAPMAQQFMRWLAEPAQRERWSSGDPRAVRALVDEICRGKQ